MHREICPLLPRLRDKMNRKILQTELPTATRYDLHTVWSPCRAITSSATGL